MNTTTPINDRVVKSGGYWRVTDSKGRVLDTFDSELGAKVYAKANNGKAEKA